MIMQYMKDFGSITTMQAYTDLGVTRLSARIKELKDSGIDIGSKPVSRKNRYGKNVTFLRYRLEV